MNAQLRAELFKLRTTRTSAWLLLSLIGLVAVSVALHVVALPAGEFTGSESQLKILGMGTTFGMLFASLLGAMSITGEIRHGLIRPTLLACPHRHRVIAAKVVASAAAGVVFGAVATLLAVAVVTTGLAARGISLAPSAGQFIQLVLGGAAASAAWAALGVGIGALVRNQVAALIGLTVWQLFVEQTLQGIAPDEARFAPGPGAGSLAGAILQQTSTYLLAPLVGGLLIVGYIAIITTAGLVATSRRDFS